MAYDLILPGGTASKLIEVCMRDDGTGQPLTGLAAASVAVKYQRDGAAAAVNLGAPAVLAALGTWETDAWKETAIAGLYQYGVPNACLAAGTSGCTLVFSATGAIAAKYRILIDPNVSVGGTGDVEVDHDYGGTDALRFTQDGAGLDGATIRAYLKSEYDAGTRKVRGRATTGTDGRWEAPMMLDDGTYYLIVSKPGAIEEKKVTVVVT